MQKVDDMRKTTRSTGLALLTAPKTLSMFIVGGSALGILGNAFYQLLTNWLSTSNFAAVRIAIGAVLVLAVVQWVLSRWVQRLRPVLPVPNKQTPAPHRGLICLVSNEPTLRKALTWHQTPLQWCRLICSEQSMPLAQKVRDELREQGKNAELVFIHDVLDPVACRNTVDRLYSNLPPDLDESDVILDFTGMTSIVSVGAVLGCLDEKRPIQYTPAVFDTELKALYPRDPIEIVLSWQLLPKPPTVAAPVQS